jgi:hypothetical protein
LLAWIVVEVLNVLAQETHGAVGKEKLSSTCVPAAETSADCWIAIRLEQWIINL